MFGPFTAYSRLMAEGYARASAKNPLMDANKMDASAFSTDKLHASRKDEQRSKAGFVVLNDDESSSSAEGEKLFGTILAKIFCLSAPSESQPYAELSRLIKTPSSLGFLGSCSGMNHRQDTNQIALNSMLFQLYLTRTATRFQAKLELF